MADEYVAEVVGGETPSSEPKETPEVTPSEPTPKEGEQPKVETPAGETPAPELYELPDGRKVSGTEVLDAYKNLQKDYTQKTQKLASYEKPDITKNNEVTDYKNPEWIPKSYGEVIERAKEEFHKDLESKQKAEQEYEQNLAAKVDAQLGEVRKIDPKVNENKLLEHATKYHIPNLVSAYKNMKEMNDRVEATRQETAKNLTKRAADPVAGASGQETPVDEAEIYDPRASTTSLLEHLRRIKQK